MADRWQLTDYTLDETALPYNRQPRAYFTWEKPFGIFEAGIYAEAVRFTHDDSYQVIRRPNTDNGNDNNGDDYVRTNIVNRDYAGGSRLDVKPYI
ncbi:LPS assembly protein LptD, partial [Pseudomonas viridiflava]|uniref:LPS assembly protein LptD n=2 Tax=Gammaproteobacteria TaxID=1236 RepID=UPI001F1559B8